VVPELVVPEVAADDVLAELAVSSSSDSELDFVDAVVALVFVLAAAVWVVVALWSCHASAPPRESIAATLSAAAALRALAARGLRRPGRRVGTRSGMAAGVEVCSSMSTKVRIVDEGVARTG
jgi:hypothetical protein